ncbi:polysialyltransferase family glycosyltransferase [Bermanella sp. R86510]|uniref:polysialyltransferase family glycosyltransferase n=1 Tax=unclassified Bermanella TaxID=2627862 RepID=UPI0037CB1776
MQNKLILASTFRHYFLGIGLALEDKSSCYHMVFIDQKYDDNRNPLLNAAKTYPAPFKTVSALPTRQGTNKRTHRKYIFTLIDSLLETLKPTEIISGNDRRIEFQYAMYAAQKKYQLNPIGGFIEDGTGNYIDTSKYNKTKTLADKYIDTPLKKLVYGTWFKRPTHLGMSDWVTNIYCTFPDKLVGTKKDKQLFKLSNKTYLNQETRQLLQPLVENLGISDDIHLEGRNILFLPHHSLIQDLYGSLSNAHDALLAQTHDNQTLVKYHPRDLEDPYNLAAHCVLLPTAVPAELLLLCGTPKKVIGDLSTALLSARWLFPSSDVRFIPTKSKYTAEITTLFKYLDIKALDSSKAP